MFVVFLCLELCYSHLLRLQTSLHFDQEMSESPSPARQERIVQVLVMLHGAVMVDVCHP